jgi:hypothetical protein
MARLLILGTLCFIFGTGSLVASFLSKRLDITIQRILQVAGGILLLSGVFILGVYLCGGNKDKKILRNTKRKRKPQELSRAYYGNENLAGPNYEGGVSVISPGSRNHQSSHLDNEQRGGRRSSRHSRVVHSPGGRAEVHKADPRRGSMDSIDSVRSTTLSFDSISSGTHPELRSSMRKPQQRDSASLTSTSSSKKSVRLALGGEMTAV